MAVANANSNTVSVLLETSCKNRNLLCKIK
ncbi:hypothetical protein [Microcystis aeruginosa]|nr:hypothetical protein [Microcystis aeruginosa]